ncbi:hypothetical protein CSC2_36020 [Clostridium zeae]|uniref:Glycosyltransferase n=1 Tax=Clostridium zeae TaxID=2759022 RepID=A0ABQ1EE33_9CLOT|nr:glycosyltransferase [Clostridium zeae]GFZ33076.1 hypothetical protein CSC2_36020 [Clostridium zeae]
MKKILRTLLISLFSLFLILEPVTARALEDTVFKDIPFSKATCDLRMAERRLWIDHVLWTRSFIVSDLASLEDKGPVLERLLKNQDDIGNSIKPYYGENAGNKLSALLREHIELAGQVAAAAKNNNKANLDKYNKLWYENADKIADFLSSANPNYSNQTLKNMLHKHLEFVTAQVVARLNKDWKADITAFDKGEDHMIMFSDILIDGIVKQFPQKF